MKYSQYFAPTLREIPSEAQIVSHRLMLRAGMIHATALGIYTWLPLAVRVMQKIERIIDEEHARVGCHRVIMPTVQPAQLWQESGRYDDYGAEMLRMKDRHDRDMLYGPTHEEVITDLARHHMKSYRDLPQVLYQIHWKFRDEIRPRFGVMRGREFLMKDAYSFDVSKEAARETYIKMYNMYLVAFARMGLKAIPVAADSGAIGGDLSHEFQIVAETGESEIFYDQAYDVLPMENRTFDQLKDLYAASDERHDVLKKGDCDHILRTRGIEVGHIFYFGTKYSESMGLSLAGADGKPFYPQMGSYGIGVSRLVGAIIEANHDEKGIVWPVNVSPFSVGLIQVKTGEATIDRVCSDIYNAMQKAGIEVLFDDRNERAGTKFNDMDLIGLPYQVIVGNQTLISNEVEIKDRRTDERYKVTVDACIPFLQNCLKEAGFSA